MHTIGRVLVLVMSFGGPSAHAQATSGAVGALSGLASIVNNVATVPGVFNSQPSPVGLNPMELQAALARCQSGGAAAAAAAASAATAGAGGALGVASAVTAGAATALNGISSMKSSPTKATCDTPCPEPGYPTEVACSQFFPTETKVGGSSTYKVAAGDSAKGAKLTLDIAAKFQAEVACYQFKASSCANTSDIQAQNDTLSCMMAALNTATTNAATLLGNAIDFNNQQFKSMSDYSNDLKSQTEQIENILGPDPKLGGSGSSQFKGLLGLQAELAEKTLPEAHAHQAEFKTAFDKATNDQKANEDTLESERAQVVVSCLKGDTTAGVGIALQCPAPKDVKTQDAPGNKPAPPVPCGPFDYLKNQIANAANANDRANAQNATSDSATFAGIAADIDRLLGAFDTATKDGRPSPQVLSWSDMVTKNPDILNKLQYLDGRPELRGVGIVNQLQYYMNKCTSDSQKWKVIQMKPGASRYSTVKQTVDSEFSTLTANVNDAMSKLTQSFSATTSLLRVSGKSLSGSCASQPDQISKYACMTAEMNDLLNGTGNTPAPGQPITAGATRFVIPCRGVNDCVSALKQVRDAATATKLQEDNLKMKFAGGANSQIDAQVSKFKQTLQSAAAAIQNQYASMKSRFLAAGATDIPDTLKLMEGEPLKPMEVGPHGERLDGTGPYVRPTDLSRVLAGGLPSTADSGLSSAISSAMKAIKEKASGYKEMAKAALEAENKYAQAATTCNSDVVHERTVGNDAQACNDFANEANNLMSISNPIGGLTSDLYTSMAQVFNDKAAGQLTKDDQAVLKNFRYPELMYSSVVSLENSMANCSPGSKTLSAEGTSFKSNAQIGK